MGRNQVFSIFAPQTQQSSNTMSTAIITKDSIEQAYCFFHQKWRIYEHSTLDWQKDDIEYAIAQYVDSMNSALYALLSKGNSHYLLQHDAFSHDMPDAVNQLDALLITGSETEKNKRNNKNI